MAKLRVAKSRFSFPVRSIRQAKARKRIAGARKRVILRRTLRKSGVDPGRKGLPGLQKLVKTLKK